MTLGPNTNIKLAVVIALLSACGVGIWRDAWYKSEITSQLGTLTRLVEKLDAKASISESSINGLNGRVSALELLGSPALRRDLDKQINRIDGHERQLMDLNSRLKAHEAGVKFPPASANDGGDLWK